MAINNYDSAFCGSLPVHQINLVQSHGVMIVVEFDTMKIVQVSENVEKFLHIPFQEVPGKHLADFLATGQLAELREKFSDGNTQRLPFTLIWKTGKENKEALVFVHQRSGYLVMEMELETRPQAKAAFTDVYQQLRYAMAAIERSSSVEDVCRAAAKEIKAFSGFDKVVIYSFDEEWNGTVIAETKEEGMEAYLGFTFPASDIPQQVRKLYLRNPYRLIPNREYQTVGLYPVINPITRTFTDLSDCSIRAVASVHLEYLKNMNVMASMSIRIIKDEQLWGLISCHHRTAKYLSFETCLVFEMLSNILSARISSLLNREHFAAASAKQEVYSRLVEQVYKENDLMKGVTAHPVTLLNVLSVPGAVIIYNRRMQTLGRTPSNEAIRELVLWLHSHRYTKLHHEENLSSVYDDALAYADVASGIIAIPINPDKGEYVIGFRPEVIREIRWGGDPGTAVNFDKDTTSYHPRNSFRIWQQRVKNTSMPWKKHELEMANQFRNFLLEYTIQKNFY